MADDYLDDEDDLEAALRAYGRRRDGADNYPAPGTYQQQGPPPYGDGRYPMNQEEREEAARNDYTPVAPPSGRQQGADNYPPPYQQQGPQPAPPYEQAGPSYSPRAEGDMPVPQAPYQQQGPMPQVRAEGDMPAQQPQPAASGFDPNAYVQNLMQPPPPPITVYRGGVPGGESPGSPPPDVEAAGYWGHALKQLEAQVQSHPHMSPQSKDIVLRKIYEEAANVAGQQSLGKGQGGQQQAPQQQFSTQQKQALAQLDGGETKISMMHARGEVDDEGYNSAMMQIADQRAAVRAKAIPQGPTPQELLQQRLVAAPDGSQFLHSKDAHGNDVFKEVKNEQHELLMHMVKENPNDALEDIAKHVGNYEAVKRGLPSAKDLPKLHGKGQKDDAESFDGMTREKQHRAVSQVMKDHPGMSPQEAVAHLRGIDAALGGGGAGGAPGFAAPGKAEIDADTRLQHEALTHAREELKPQPGSLDGPPPMDKVVARAAEWYQALGGRGAFGKALGDVRRGAAQNNGGGAGQPAASEADRYFNAFAGNNPAVAPLRPVLQKAYAGNDAEGIIATKTAIHALSRGPTNLSLRERYEYREALKVLRRQDDKVKVPSLTELNVPEDYEPPEPPQPPPYQPRGNQMMYEAGPPV